MNVIVMLALSGKESILGLRPSHGQLKRLHAVGTGDDVHPCRPECVDPTLAVPQVLVVRRLHQRREGDSHVVVRLAHGIRSRFPHFEDAREHVWASL